MKTNKWILFSLAALICVAMMGGMYACSTGNAKEKNKELNAEPKKSAVFSMTKDQLGVMNIAFAQPEKKAIESFLYLNGKVKALPNLQATISSDTDGKIEEIFVHEGSAVAQGQAIITLRSMHLIELQNDYLTAKSEMDYLAIEYKRQQELRQNNIGALADYQTVAAKYEAAQGREKTIRAKLEILGVDLNNLQNPAKAQITRKVIIRSPVSGYVHKLPVKVGMLASPETVLAEVVNVSELRADLFAYDKDLSLISEGQTVELDFVNEKIPHLSGKVIHIERMIDTETKATSIHVQFNTSGKENLVFPGMSVRAVLKDASRNEMAYTVPAAALLQDDDFFYVYTTENPNNKNIQLKKHKVKVGKRNEKIAEIVFLNPVLEKNLYIAQNNVMIIEAERKKQQGNL
jgi:RND family efflux transporter MFP subunit